MNSKSIKDIVKEYHFEPTAESHTMIRGILSSPLTEHIVSLLLIKAKKDPNFSSSLEQIIRGNYDFKFPEMTFNDVSDNSKASRTTVHVALTLLFKEYGVIANEERYVQTPPGKRLATVYSLKPKAIPVILFLFPSWFDDSV